MNRNIDKQIASSLKNAPRNDTRGQTALILILLAAAALIFLAITLNWGRIAQTKALLSVSADESASLLASDAASYGEMQKQTYLKDKNNLTETTSILLAIVMVIIAIVVAIFFPPVGAFMIALTIASIVMAVVSLVLQLVVVQPGITTLWNKLQKNQPIQQQFYEGGIATSLQGSVGDQVNITDYLDWNANGIFGNTNNSPNDTVSRFAVFYTDRLKMLNQQPIPQVVLFYDQLGEFMNGETCDQNESDYKTSPGIITINPACLSLNSSPTYCIGNSADPACEEKIPDGFQLNDACTGSDPADTATYSPYCDPCCQPLNVLDPLYSASNPNPLHPTQYKSQRPSNCDQSASPSQCLANNPYGSPYTLLYDPAFQNYTAGISFLGQFGRDQQMAPFTTSLTPQGSATNGVFFPDGVYPFFWLMDEYSPQVDNIDSSNLQSSQIHWCVAPGYAQPSGAALTEFPELAQLSLPYSCQGQDCCVNYLPESVTGGVPTPPSGSAPSWIIDTVGSGSNPAGNSEFGISGTGSWVRGDSQMCLSAWPYNGATANTPDGTCDTSSPSTLDSLDETMHTLSDFVKFSQVFLNNDVGTLSSTFKTWYDQAAQWIDPASKGRLLTIYNPASGVDELKGWDTLITNWLDQTYTSSGAWCVPSERELLSGNGSTAEDAYINSNSGTATWGDLPHVVACLNYNSNQSINGTPANFGSVYNYQQCLNALTSGTCPSSLPAACTASILGRSLAGPNPNNFNRSCNVTVAGSYAKWVNDSVTLSVDEAPKFLVRAQFLNDIYTRAKTMQTIFSAGDAALKQFLLPCSGADCADGGPAAQLVYASTQPSPTAVLPNSVIYGWVDNTYPNGQQGYAHIVKITAYSPGRNGNSGLPLPVPQSGGSTLPWIQTKTNGFLDLTRSYTLMNRDGYVYVSVKRWDEDHSPVNFPNGHHLWQFLFHNPSAGSTANSSGTGFANCLGAYPGSAKIGIGLESATVQGLEYNSQLSSADQTALGKAFMLNDNVNGSVDPNSHTGAYAACLSWANGLLTNAPESHACAEYIASTNASGASTNGDKDYSLKFVNCPSNPPEDLGSS